ncbi:uncharacterized protein LOC115070224 [Nannospalax galili]|uniref:uncharacterized protein LOC115070224 n=1 Tax=Nannospalax galili TaxID=1026970 RepID=UPI00111BD6C6|nr:uncharacterized protein LOC115070224 [Nannospalax galili]
MHSEQRYGRGAASTSRCSNLSFLWKNTRVFRHKSLWFRSSSRSWEVQFRLLRPGLGPPPSRDLAASPARAALPALSRNPPPLRPGPWGRPGSGAPAAARRCPPRRPGFGPAPGTGSRSAWTAPHPGRPPRTARIPAASAAWFRGSQQAYHLRGAAARDSDARLGVGGRRPGRGLGGSGNRAARRAWQPSCCSGRSWPPGGTGQPTVGALLGALMLGKKFCFIPEMDVVLRFGVQSSGETELLHNMR